MVVKLAIAALIVGAAGLGMLHWVTPPQNTTATFICPELHSQATPMALKETAADVAYASAALSGAAPENAIRVIATDLKRRHPQVDKGEIVNYLLTAYCPFVKQASGLTEREKRERMDRFSAQAYALVQ